MCGVELLRIVVRLLEFVRGAFFDKLSTGRTAAKYWGDESASATCNPSVKPATAANPPPEHISQKSRTDVQDFLSDNAIVRLHIR
jgi:hypothetical protein